MSQRAPRTAAPEARARIVAAARALVYERPFSELTVDDLMARAGLARTVFYRHYDGLLELAPALYPDVDAPTVDRIAAPDGPRPHWS